MTSAAAENQPWSPRRWSLLVAMVFLTQLALIFWLSDRTPPRSRKPNSAPVLGLAGNGSAELLALQDPTLFALPHREGFSGLAWLSGWRLPPRSFDWSDTTNWLRLDAGGLGVVFSYLAKTNQPGAVQTLVMPPPEAAAPSVATSSPLPPESVLRLEDAPGRKLVSSEPLRVWEHTEILTNSVVQVMVGRDGRPFSWILLSGSGLKDADDFALSHARRVRFDSLAGESGPPASGGALTDLDWGKLVYQWHTIPRPPTNAPPAKP
jgi:hypothetical protein